MTVAGPPPPLPPATTRPDFNARPGVIYAAGTYPTPELSNSPAERYATVQGSQFNSSEIQKVLDSLGPQSTVYLPQRSRWLITSPILLVDYQEIATEGYPTDEPSMAILEASEDLKPNVLNAFGRTGVKIRNLIVEGNREKYGFMPAGGVMVQLGGNPSKGQHMDHCILRNPRSWSCVQAFEYAENVRITNNRIGPAGTGADLDGGKWADGISYAAAKGLVAGNLIHDTTDGGIVVFGAPGTLVTSNTVVTHTRLGLGAINMVDYAPLKGNYNDTVVDHNTIVTAGNLLKIGIGQGSTVWWQVSPDQRSNRIAGGTVTNNLITTSSPDYPVDNTKGRGAIGYGFPIGADVKDWKSLGNVADPSVLFQGDISSTITQGYVNAAPGAFIHDKWGHEPGLEADTRNLTLQPEYAQGTIWGLISITAGPTAAVGYDPGSLFATRGAEVALRDIKVRFTDNGTIDVVRDQDLLWRWNSTIEPSDRESARLHFSPGGKFCIVIPEQQKILVDITPHIPFYPNTPPNTRPIAPKLILSANEPYLSVSCTNGDTLFASSYTVGLQTVFQYNGRFFARPTPDLGGALVYAMGPKGQFIVAHTLSVLQNYRLEWPLNPDDFSVVYQLGTAGDLDSNSTLIIQADGNMVIYSQGGKPTWASNTGGERGAKKLFFGLGTPEEPFLELRDATGNRVWSTT